MNAMPRWSFRRVPTFIAFAMLASISFVVVFLSSREIPSFVQLQRRHEHLVARQSGAAAPQNSSSPNSGAASKTTTGSSTSEPFLSSASATSGSSSHPIVKPAATKSSGSPIISQSTSQSESTTNTSSVPFLSQSPSTTSIPPAVPMTDPRTQPPSPTIQPDPSATLFSTTTTDIFPTSTITFGIDPSSTPSQTAIAATASSGFWQNKPAVAGTFVVLTLIVLGAAAGVTVSYYKKRNARMHDRLHDQLFDEPEGTRNSSPGLSINAAPIDPFATREIHHVELFPQSHTRVPYKSSQEIGFYGSPTKAVPQGLRSQVGRKSYQTSIDSFYGASPSSG